VTAFTPAQLAAELNTDPKTLGYAALIAAKDRIGLAAKINSTYAAVGTVWRTDLRAAEILAALVETEITALTTNGWLQLQTLLIPGTVDASQVTIRNQFNGLLGAFATTIANLLAVAKKANPSRAEELWGYAVRVTEQDVAGAIG
jgi:hypothetical protein